MKLSMKMMMADICLDSNVDEDDSDNVWFCVNEKFFTQVKLFFYMNLLIY